jgi:hypothetical protein
MWTQHTALNEVILSQFKTICNFGFKPNKHMNVFTKYTYFITIIWQCILNACTSSYKAIVYRITYCVVFTIMYYLLWCTLPARDDRKYKFLVYCRYAMDLCVTDSVTLLDRYCAGIHSPIITYRCIPLAIMWYVLYTERN